jgi:hypothetical protein
MKIIIADVNGGMGGEVWSPYAVLFFNIANVAL